MESRRAAPHLFLIMLTALTGLAQEPASHPPRQQTSRTRVVLLGTGTPVPDPDRSGPATAVVVETPLTLSILGLALCGARRPLLSREGYRRSNRAI
jgi:hypothetical protein